MNDGVFYDQEIEPMINKHFTEIRSRVNVTMLYLHEQLVKILCTRQYLSRIHDPKIRIRKALNILHALIGDKLANGTLVYNE